MCDLGDIVDPALKFRPNSHINYIVANANTRASLIHKCFLSRNTKVMLRAFKVYVRPLLDYATSVWSPYFNYAIDTSGSAMAEGPRDALVSRNSATTKYPY